MISVPLPDLQSLRSQNIDVALGSGDYTVDSIPFSNLKLYCMKEKTTNSS